MITMLLLTLQVLGWLPEMCAFNMQSAYHTELYWLYHLLLGLPFKYGVLVSISFVNSSLLVQFSPSVYHKITYQIFTFNSEIKM